MLSATGCYHQQHEITFNIANLPLTLVFLIEITINRVLKL